jgi:hypothetical protein
MATTDTSNLSHCAYCQQPLAVVDGTDPDDSSESFWELYECANGHTGRYDWDAGGGVVTKRYTGACIE